MAKSPKNHRLIIVRGVSGSGKTHYVKNTIVHNAPHIKHMEADMCYKNGVFSRFESSAAHARCRRVVRKLLKKGFTVAVSNTFTHHAELAPYYAMAKMHGATTDIIRIDRDKPKPLHGDISISERDRKRMVFIQGELVINNNWLDGGRKIKPKIQIKPRTYPIWERDVCFECGESPEVCEDFKYAQIFRDFENDYPMLHLDGTPRGFPDWRNII
jgi:predicted kinase